MWIKTGILVYFVNESTYFMIMLKTKRLAKATTTIYFIQTQMASQLSDMTGFGYVIERIRCWHGGVAATTPTNEMLMVVRVLRWPNTNNFPLHYQLATILFSRSGWIMQFIHFTHSNRTTIKQFPSLISDRYCAYSTHTLDYPLHIHRRVCRVWCAQPWSICYFEMCNKICTWLFDAGNDHFYSGSLSGVVFFLLLLFPASFPLYFLFIYRGANIVYKTS